MLSTLAAETSRFLSTWRLAVCRRTPCHFPERKVPAHKNNIPIHNSLFNGSLFGEKSSSSSSSARAKVAKNKKENLSFECDVKVAK